MIWIILDGFRKVLHGFLSVEKKNEKDLSTTRRVRIRQFNPLTPKSDQHLISPYSIIPESNIKVTRIKEMITNKKKSC